LAAGRTATGIDGTVVNSANNRALQLAAIQKIIKAQDAEQIENMFMDRAVDKTMLVSELTKENNYSTSKGAGAHFVQMDPHTYTRDQIDHEALIAMSTLAPDKLAAQDGPSWRSAARGFTTADPLTLTQRQTLWDRANDIQGDPRAMAQLKGSARAAFNTIYNGGVRPII